MQVKEWAKVDELAEAFSKRFGDPPEVMLVLGSGLGDSVKSLSDALVVPSDEFPHMPTAAVAGHAGRIQLGRWGDMRVLVQQGRVHYYEGWSPAQVVRTVRAAAAWGVKVILLTNAAGSLDINLAPGTLMLIEDHLNLTGANPLIGPNDDARGTRFPALNNLYDPKLMAHFRHYGAERGVVMSTGIYAGLSGPSYETQAEVRMLAGFGAQAVGMSTVLESIAGYHLGMKVLGLSCITNYAAGLEQSQPTHEEVAQVGQSVAREIALVLEESVPCIGEVLR